VRAILRLLALIVPRNERPRWREEWLAEIEHGGWRMLTGAIPDAWTVRQLHQAPRFRRRHAFHAIGQDARYAVRGLLRNKGFAVAVIGSLAIGIAATTTAFALINASLLRPFPGIGDQNRLVRVAVGVGRTYSPTTWEQYRRLRDGLTSVSGLAAAHQTQFAVATDEESGSRTVDGLIVSGNYFEVLGVEPAVGRFFITEEDDVPWQRPAAVISYRYWERMLSADPLVLQRTLIVNGAELPIVGVAARGFDGVFGSAQVWTTFATSDLALRDEEGGRIHARDAEPFRTIFIGRLKASSTLEQARAEAAVLTSSTAPAREGGRGIAAVSVGPLQERDAVRDGLQAVGFMAVPLMVLAIACVNAANLLVARATQRSTEWLIRLSVGASRWRLIRLLLVESLVLAIAAGALGILLCVWTVGIAHRHLQVVLFARSVVIDANVLLFTLAASVATALLFGLGPAVSVTRNRAAGRPEAARMRGPLGSRTRAYLIVLQAALCLGLLSTAAQFSRTLQAMLASDGLPDAEHFLSASVDVGKLQYTPAMVSSFYSQLLQKVSELPTVRAAALVDTDVLSGGLPESPIRVSIPGEVERRRGIVSVYAAGDFFNAVGLPIVRGRAFSTPDFQGPPHSVVVNERFSRANGDLLGRTIRISGDRDGKVTIDAVVVGVVASAPDARLDSLPTVFYPAPLVPKPALTVLARFDGGSAEAAAALRRTVASLDSRVPVDRMFTGEELRERRYTWEQTLTGAVSILGVLALVLASAGLHGVVSYVVAQRKKEMGIRFALGAEAASVLGMIVRQSLRPVLAGCLIGAGGAAIVSMLLRARLYGMSPVDPVAFAGAALVLLCAMLAACVGPARRAAQVDPVQVLRAE
jgi:predicted permease